MEESICDAFTWEILKYNFIKDFVFPRVEEFLQGAVHELHQFINPTIQQDEGYNENAPKCKLISAEQKPSSHDFTLLDMENNKSEGKRFQWKKKHPMVNWPIRAVLKISMKDTGNKEEQKDFPPTFT